MSETIHKRVQQKSVPIHDGESIHWREVLLCTVAVFMTLALFQLFSQNMGGNEVDVLPLARQFADPAWLPNDWYLNQPPGYRLLFQLLAGNLASRIGFLWTSIMGRATCLLMFSVGLGLIAEKLKLKPIFLIFALLIYTSLHLYRGAVPSVGVYYPGFIEARIGQANTEILFWVFFEASACLFAVTLLIKKQILPWTLCLLLWSALMLADNRPYSIVANEWFTGGLEAKSVAYGIVFMGIALAFRRKYYLASLLFGLATSFHVLAGGYAAITFFLFVLLRARSFLADIRTAVSLLGLYILGSVFAIPAVVKQLLSSSVSSSSGEDFSASSIYVFTRLPHHLNPAAWPSHWPFNLFIYLFVLIASVKFIDTIQFRNSPLFSSGKSPESNAFSTDSVFDLFYFTLLSLIPFAIGISLAPFDKSGSILQYYLFRFGDAMLPLSTAMLFSLGIQCTLGQSATSVRKSLYFLVILFISISLMLGFDALKKDLRTLSDFPKLSPELSQLYGWVKTDTSKEDIFIFPPAGFENFSWICERNLIVNFKLLPQSKQGIFEWSQRITDLMGGSTEWQNNVSAKSSDTFSHFSNLSKLAYRKLDTEYVEGLLKKYEAQYFVSDPEHPILLPAVFKNDAYIVYTANQ